MRSVRTRDGEVVTYRTTCEGCPQYCYDYVDSVCPFSRRSDEDEKTHSKDDG